MPIAYNINLRLKPSWQKQSAALRASALSTALQNPDDINLRRNRPGRVELTKLAKTVPAINVADPAAEAEIRYQVT